MSTTVILLVGLGLSIAGVALVGWVGRKVYAALPGGTVEGLGHLYRGANLWITLIGMLLLAGGLALLTELLPENWQFWLGGSR